MVQPNKWGEVLGYNADYNQLPEDATLTASFSKLFPEITQIPLEVGGTPPKRMDLNAIFKLIGDNIYYYQNGGVFEYNDNFRYEVGNVIRFNDKIFLCIRENSKTDKHAPNDAGYWQQITTNDILRNYVKSVNGITPDANGNVSFSYVKYTDLTPYAKRTELEPKADRTELAPLATKTEVEIACPVGTVHAFAGVYAPNGWLLCNGQAVSRSQFSRLFSVISTRYGGGDGYSTFNVPDMRDRFIEGAHSYNVGTPLSAGIPNITASASEFYCNGDHINTNGAMYQASATYDDLMGSSDFWKQYRVGLGFDASRSSAVYGRSSTVQPNALNMNFIIKY